MAKQLKKIFTGNDKVVQNFKIQSWHVSQSVDAFTGNDDYDIQYDDDWCGFDHLNSKYMNVNQ